MTLAPKRILVITTCFAPERAIGSVRLSKFVKYLVRLGYEVTVVSPRLGADVPRDRSLESPELERVRRVTVAQSGWFDALFSRSRKRALAGASAAKLITSSPADSMGRRVRTSIARYVQFAYTLVRNVDWSRRVRAHFDEESDHYDVVVSSYPSLGAMWAASSARRSGIAERWVADFRDPVNYSESSGFIHRVNTVIQRRILAGADAVVTVSAGVAMKLSEGSAANCVVVPNGYDPDDLSPGCTEAARRLPGPARFCYTGSLHGGRRDLTPLFAALQSLCDQGRVASDGFLVEYAGKDFETLREQAQRRGLSGRLVDHGFVSREQSISLQQQSDALIVATWNTPGDQGIMTGKLFECFLLRKPVIGLVAGDLAGSELKTVLSDVGAGIAFESADPGGFAALERFVEMVCSSAAAGDPAATGYTAAVERYAYPRLTEALASVIEGT